MTNYDMPALVLDPQKIKPFFHNNMEQGVVDALTPNFMDFSMREFTQFE